MILACPCFWLDASASLGWSLAFVFRRAILAWPPNDGGGSLEPLGREWVRDRQAGGEGNYSRNFGRFPNTHTREGKSAGHPSMGRTEMDAIEQAIAANSDRLLWLVSRRGGSGAMLRRCGPAIASRRTPTHAEVMR